MISMLLFLAGIPAGMTAVSLPMETTWEALQQDGACRGVVKDASGETVIGATVVVKGTTNGTITGIEGDKVLSHVKKGDLQQLTSDRYVSK